MDALEALRTRRSYSRLTEPAPSEAELKLILEAGAAAPDHGELRPVRFTLLRNSGRDALGEVLRDTYLSRCAAEQVTPVAAKVEKERTKLTRAPLVIIVQAVRQPSTQIPWQDQRDAAVAASMNILLAVHTLGYGAIWRTGEVCDNLDVKERLGIGAADAIAGFIYIGTVVQPKEPRQIELSGLVSEFDARS